jgi:hypothetical protein
MSIQPTTVDPLYEQPAAQRPAYSTGMLLDAQDFSDEQTYHRGRLARAMAFLAGGGTLAGLEVSHTPATATQAEEIRVAPGLAVDRLGRQVEIVRPACLRLERWFTALLAAGADDDTANLASYDDLAAFVSPRMSDAATPLPARALVADVFLRFAACEVGLTPSFAQGPFDALNAVSTSRLRDAYELQLVPRLGLGPTTAGTYTGLPLPPGDPVIGDTTATAAERRNAVQDAVLHGYGGSGQAGGSGGLAPLPEHPAGLDRSAVFLARVFIPVDNANPPARTAGAPLVDNWARRILPPVALLGQWAGF